MTDDSTEKQVKDLLWQLHRMVDATPVEERVRLLEGLLVSADEIIEQGPTESRLVQELKALRDSLRPQVHWDRTAERLQVPISVVEQAEGWPEFGSKVVEVKPPGPYRIVYLGGIRTENGPFEIMIDAIEIGPLTVLSGPVEASVYNTAFPFVPQDLGAIQHTAPAIVRFSAFGAPSMPPYLNLTFFAEAHHDFPLGSNFGRPVR